MAKQIWIKEETAEKIKNFLIKSYGKPVIENRSAANIVEYGVEKLLEKAQKDSLAETLLNDFESITSIEMAENIAENLFELGSPARDTVEALAQNYKECKED